MTPVDRKTIAALVKKAGLAKKKKLGPGERMIRGVLHYARPLRDDSGKYVMKDGKKVWEWVPRIQNKDAIAKEKAK